MNKIKNLLNILKNFITLKNNLLLIFISVIFFFDRLSKIKIIKLQLENNSKLFINEYLNFDLVWNTGIGFGLFNLEASIAYHLISLFIFVIILILIYLMIKSDNFERFSYSLLLGGAIGNFYDRINYFAVPDFIDFHINNYHWFTFNIADIFITIGIIFLMLNELIFKKYEKK
mgnify:CR=1 FL=1